MIHADDHYDPTQESQIATSCNCRLYQIYIYITFPPNKPISGVSKRQFTYYHPLI